MPAGTENDGLPENAACALCYAMGFITGVLFLTLAPYNESRQVRFHAWQSILFSVVVIAVYVLTIVAAIVLPAGFVAVLGFFGLLAMFAAVGLWVVTMYKVYLGESWVLPLVGVVARKRTG